MNQSSEIRPQNILNSYNQRYTSLKKARLYAKSKDISKALFHYQTYLNAIANWHKLESVEKIQPQLFDSQNELGELLMLSQTYWDLAKIFDRTQNATEEVQKNLEKFVLFSKDFKFQRINAQMMKKYINKKAPQNPKIFKNYYEKIQIDSGLCFLATFAFPGDEIKLKSFRSFKKVIVKKKYGFKFVEIYYQTSPLLVEFFEKHPLLNFIFFTCLIKPLLYLFYLFLTLIKFSTRKE